MQIAIVLSEFYSPGDERRFFQGLVDISAIKSIVGSGKGLILGLNTRSLSREALEDLIALLWRYQISIKPLGALALKKRFAWLRDKNRYWHESLLGAKNGAGMRSATSTRPRATGRLSATAKAQHAGRHSHE